LLACSRFVAEDYMGLDLYESNTLRNDY